MNKKDNDELIHFIFMYSPDYKQIGLTVDSDTPISGREFLQCLQEIINDYKDRPEDLLNVDIQEVSHLQ